MAHIWTTYPPLPTTTADNTGKRPFLRGIIFGCRQLSRVALLYRFRFPLAILVASMNSPLRRRVARSKINFMRDMRHATRNIQYTNAQRAERHGATSDPKIEVREDYGEGRDAEVLGAL